MRLIPATEEEQMVLSEALLVAAHGLLEDAKLDERRGRYSSAVENLRYADTLMSWREELDDLEV